MVCWCHPLFQRSACLDFYISYYKHVGNSTGAVLSSLQTLFCLKNLKISEVKWQVEEYPSPLLWTFVFCTWVQVLIFFGMHNVYVSHFIVHVGRWLLNEDGVVRYWKKKWSLRADWLIAPELIPGFCSMKRLSTPSGRDASPSQVIPPQFVRFPQQFAG